ncbi:GNAT family N-acetyltransferase [Microbulbifer hydrolyticus]|uniref:GNAT family N-acetyltransferase n=1 Tax=Microbulbifer hydrolyticus TaxID=48074 RepID=A0A6P1T9U8_9GAMM|nr:GNAT family N-acetyltransferase [Microbulbifer hydrolyticus]MBB5211211.1 ribosomal protein S18 acetylase RimI-like enzyme [Microbulbifer hydrolyticus]QHQ38019.1 GNAT family N-acetyltransferase [Microbulbifer hydrolyticus]
MSELSFRPCRAQDADAAVPLIYSSGPGAFDYVFCDRSKQQARDFLHHAFVRGDSEFGYRQHIAAVIDGEVVAVGAVRNSNQNLRFTIAALRDIVRFYSPLAAARVVVRGLRTEMVISPPKKDAGVIYHLGVAEAIRGRGIGGALMAELLRRVQQHEFSVAALDVAATNPRAKALYERLGFTAQRTTQSSLRSAFGQVVDHTYMELPLATQLPE